MNDRDRLSRIRDTLEQHGQSHLLRFFDDLTADQKQLLLDDIEQVNFNQLDDLIDRFVRHPSPPEDIGELEPADYYPLPPTDAYDENAYREAGEELIRTGKVAAFTVAGGQGTRLGWRGPKGTFPGTPVTGKPLFQVFAEQLRAVENRFGVTIPWYIMTSPINHEPTRAFFQDNNFFGLSRRNIFLFPQDVLPSLDATTGKLMLADKHRLAVNPNGHGGSIQALRDSGAIEDMTQRGIEHISYFQVDNPLVKTVDPLFIGLHATAPDSSAEMSSKMVAKAYPEEKVGVFCNENGRTIVIEYSDLPDELARQRDPDGRLRYRAGSIAVHVIGVEFVANLNVEDDGFVLPLHRAIKKVPYVDTETGEKVEPDEPNGVKLEMFIFDAIPKADSSIILETGRADEFAPIKNKTGVDSIETSYQLQSDHYARWLEQHSVDLPWDEEGHVQAKIEISPLTALAPGDLKRVERPQSIQPGESVAL